MDVVRSNITDLGGSVSVLSDEGKGTQDPTSVALDPGSHYRGARLVARAALCGADGIGAGDSQGLATRPYTLNGRHAISLRGEIIPVVSLAEVLSSSHHVAVRGDSRSPAADRSGRVPIVVVATGTTRYGIRVDELRGQQEIVIKALPGQLGQLPGLAGATIMGDGSVVLILDPASLYDFVLAHNAAPTTPTTASMTR